MSLYRGLPRRAANHRPLSPIDLLDRAAELHPERPALRFGREERSYGALHRRALALGSALRGRGVSRGQTVAVLAPNVPAMLESHYGVPMAGAVLNTQNTRLDARALAYMIEHAEARVWLVDRALGSLAQQALAHTRRRPLMVCIDEPGDARPPARSDALQGALPYEDLLAEGDPEQPWLRPEDEWDAIALNYTSGTTGVPKGVVYHHRGAYLLSLGNILSAGLDQGSRFLWTVPMFHCNGWCFTWGLAVVGAMHICQREVRGAAIVEAIDRDRVSHLCGAPVVLDAILQAQVSQPRRSAHPVRVFTGGAPPPAAVIEAMEGAGFDVTHLYGLTETYGPAVVNVWQSRWDALSVQERAQLKARQGVRHPVLEGLSVRDPERMTEVPADGQTVGEVMLRGNIVMRGYLGDEEATERAFRGGWFHSGDLGVRHPDGYIQLTDRAKDIIISGGENISSIEVEGALYRHPSVRGAAVVARPDPRWGETPCAFVDLDPARPAADQAELIAHCRGLLAHFKCPRHVVFGALPRTSTGKVKKFELRERARRASESGEPASEP